MPKENTARNKITKQLAHKSRVINHAIKRGYDPVLLGVYHAVKVPRGTARRLRRAPLTVAYAKNRAPDTVQA